MADVVEQSTQPALGAIKLAWWRERLEELDRGKVPAEPRLQRAAEELLPRGISGADMARLEEGWLALFQPVLEPRVILARGALLFELAARLLGFSTDLAVRGAGELYAAGQLQRRKLTSPDRFVNTSMRGVPRKLRPLTGMAAIARRDLQHDEPEGTPGRAFALLQHRLTGRY